MGRCISLVVCLTLVTVGAANAAPVTWSYIGTVDKYVNFSSPVFPLPDPCTTFGWCDLPNLLPVGSPIAVDIHIDPATPMASHCDGFFEGAISHIDLHLLGVTYTTTSAYAFVDGRGFSPPCVGVWPSGFEIVTPGVWSGPQLAPNMFVPLRSQPHLAGFTGRFANGPDLPTSPPVLTFVSPGFVFGHPPAEVRFAFQATLTPVPEPATMLLLGTGLAGLAARRYRRKEL